MKGDKSNPYYKIWSRNLEDYIYVTGEHRILNNEEDDVRKLDDIFENYIKVSSYGKAEKTHKHDTELYCLITSDRHVFFKFMVKTISEKHGLNLHVTDFKPLITMKLGYDELNSPLITLFTQEMLKQHFLAANSVYVCTEHEEKVVDQLYHLLQQQQHFYMFCYSSIKSFLDNDLYFLKSSLYCLELVLLGK